MKRPGPIIITGFMGCGKSKVAYELARRLNVVTVDLDNWITAHEGRNPAQLITEEGEAAFRAIETKALSELLERGEFGVIALGGGAWIEETNRDLIEKYRCTTIWLDTPFAVCWNRIVTSAEERPLGKTREEAEARYHRRRPIYQLASIHIQSSKEDSLDQLVARFLGRNQTGFQDSQG